MIPAGVSYSGLRVISPMHTPSMAGAVIRDRATCAALGRTGFYGLGLGATRREKACTAFSFVDAGGQTALAAWNQAKTDPKYGTADPTAQAVSTVVSSLTTAIGNAACPPSVPAAGQSQSNGQVDALLAQNNAMLAALAQQRQAPMSPPPPPAASAGIDKQTLLIGGAIAAGVVALLVLRK